MPRAEAVFTGVAILLAIALSISGYAEGYPQEALFFPVLVTVCLVVFAGIRVLEARRHLAAAGTAVHPANADGEEELEERAAALAFVRPFLWVFGIIVALVVLGYQLGLAVYVFLFLVAHRTSLWLSLVIAAGTAVFVHLVFVRLLQVLLPTGLLGLF